MRGLPDRLTDVGDATSKSMKSIFQHFDLDNSLSRSKLYGRVVEENYKQKNNTLVRQNNFKTIQPQRQRPSLSDLAENEK